MTIMDALDAVLSFHTVTYPHTQILFNISPEDWELPVKSPPAGV